MTSLLEILDINTGLALGAGVLSLLWWISVRRPAGAPPGPWLAVPLLGHLLLMMKKDPRQQFAAWRRQYGDVFSLYLGSQLVVVLNGYKVLKEALVNNADVFSHRPFGSFTGVFDTSGPVWKAQRKVSTQILRELGMGKNVLAAKIEEEVKEYIRVISESQGQPLDLKHLTQASVSNNICSIVLGKRFEYDDDVFGNILRLMDAIIHDAGAGALVSSIPFLRHLPGDYFKLNRFVDNMRLALQKFIKPFVDEHNSRFEEGSYDDFIGASALLASFSFIQSSLGFFFFIIVVTFLFIVPIRIFALSLVSLLCLCHICMHHGPDTDRRQCHSRCGVSMKCLQSPCLALMLVLLHPLIGTL